MFSVGGFSIFWVLFEWFIIPLGGEPLSPDPIPFCLKLLSGSPVSSGEDQQPTVLKFQLVILSAATLAHAELLP